MTENKPILYSKDDVCGACLHHKQAHTKASQQLYYCACCKKLCEAIDFDKKHLTTYQQNSNNQKASKWLAAMADGNGNGKQAAPSISNADNQAPNDLTGR